MTLTFGSLFAGVGGFDLGLERSGMVCKWQVEKDSFCLKVLDKHWPDVPKYEDVRDFADALTEANKRTGNAIRGYIPGGTEPPASSNKDGCKPSVNVEDVEDQNENATTTQIWEQQSFLSRGSDSSGFGTEQSRESSIEGRDNTASSVRDMQSGTTPVQGRSDSDSITPSRLQQADGGQVAMSEMPPQRSQGYEKCLKEMLGNPQAFRVDLICGGFP